MGVVRLKLDRRALNELAGRTTGRLQRELQRGAGRPGCTVELRPAEIYYLEEHLAEMPPRTRTPISFAASDMRLLEEHERRRDARMRRLRDRGRAQVQERLGS